MTHHKPWLFGALAALATLIANWVPSANPPKAVTFTVYVTGYGATENPAANNCNAVGKEKKEGFNLWKGAHAAWTDKDSFVLLPMQDYEREELNDHDKQEQV